MADPYGCCDKIRLSKFMLNWHCNAVRGGAYFVGTRRFSSSLQFKTT